MKNKLVFRLIMAGIWLGITAGCTGTVLQQSDTGAEVQAEALITSYQNLHGTPTPGETPAIPTLLPTLFSPYTPTPIPVALPANIAFVFDRDGNSEIYMMNANSSNQLRLTNNEAEDYSPAWSPDGKYIAFVSTRDDNSEIYRMNADGSNQLLLTNNEAKDYSPVWSPDGKHIAFVYNDGSGRDGKNGIYAKEIYIMDADGSNQTRLTNNKASDDSPSWSPDGKKVLFSSWPGSGPALIYVMNPDGSEPTRLTKTLSSDNSEHWPVWSPDGKRVAFVCSFMLCSVMVDGSGLMNYNISTSGAPSWSLDSKYIVIGANRGSDKYILMINADSLEQVRLTYDSQKYSDPVWSPVCTSCP
jgi:Tol biopolymer transport system component